ALERGVRGVEDALQVDGDQPVPHRRVALHEEVQPLPAGVVDQDVERPERTLDRRYRTADGLPIRHVGGRSRRAAAGRPDLGRHRFRPRAVEVHDPDREPVAGEPQRDGPADAAPRPGDERDGAHACYPRPGSAAVKLPLTATSPFWLTACTSPSIRRSPSASYFRVTFPIDTIVSPGQTRVARPRSRPPTSRLRTRRSHLPCPPLS